jgi:branched-chain amino acid aminotransferase
LWSINRESLAIAGKSRKEILREFPIVTPLRGTAAAWMAIMAQTIAPVSFSQTWTFFEGAWHDGNVPIIGPRTHAAWLGSTVFDGARAFEGVAPDLDRHCARVNQSAVNFKLKPVVDSETWLGLAREGMARFDANAELYIRPMYWPQTGSGGGVLFDPETTNWCLCIYVAPMPQPTGSAITLSPFRRPTMEPRRSIARRHASIRTIRAR